MIRGNCFTNLDGYNYEEWPKVFCGVPRKGERIISKKGKALRVCDITYYVDFEGKPEIIVELTNAIQAIKKGWRNYSIQAEEE